MSIKTLQTHLHNTLLNLRRLERLFNAPEFFGLYTEVECVSLIKLVQSGQYEQAIVHIERLRARDLTLLTVRELRIKAAKCGIPRYSTYSKDELIELLTSGSLCNVSVIESSEKQSV